MATNIKHLIKEQLDGVIIATPDRTRILGIHSIQLLLAGVIAIGDQTGK